MLDSLGPAGNEYCGAALWLSALCAWHRECSSAGTGGWFGLPFRVGRFITHFHTCRFLRGEGALAPSVAVGWHCPQRGWHCPQRGWRCLLPGARVLAAASGPYAAGERTTGWGAASSSVHWRYARMALAVWCLLATAVYAASCFCRGPSPAEGDVLLAQGHHGRHRSCFLLFPSSGNHGWCLCSRFRHCGLVTLFS